METQRVTVDGKEIEIVTKLDEGIDEVLLFDEENTNEENIDEQN